jgi:hypothetical protein
MVIPGVEINTDVDRGEAHVLGYFIDYRSAELAVTVGGRIKRGWSRQSLSNPIAASCRGWREGGIRRTPEENARIAGRCLLVYRPSCR